MRQFLSFSLCAALLFIALSEGLYAYSCCAFNGMNGQGIISITPTFGIPFQSATAATMDLTGAYGLTPNIDVFADTANLTLNNGINYNYSWIMPRFEIYPGNILAIQLQYNKTDIASFSLTPQYHYFYENDALALEFNMGFSIPVNSAGDSTLYIVAAPVWKAVKGILHPFVEFTPSYSMSDGGSFKLNIHAGAWLGIPDTPHQFCLSVGINDVLADTRNYDLIFWYSLSFNLIPDNNKKEI